MEAFPGYYLGLVNQTHLWAPPAFSQCGGYHHLAIQSDPSCKQLEGRKEEGGKEDTHNKDKILIPG